MSALVQQVVSSQQHQQNPPNIALDPKLIDNLRTDIAKDTGREYAELLVQQNAAALQQTKEKQDKIVRAMLDGIRPMMVLQERILEYFGSDEKEFVDEEDELDEDGSGAMGMEFETGGDVFGGLR